MSRSARSAPAKVRDLVTVKGIRNGLLFVLADDVDIADVLEELEHKLEGQIKSDGTLTAYVECGQRKVTDDDERMIRKLFATHGNLIVGGFAGAPTVSSLRHKDPYVFKGTVRSGMLIEHDGDVVIIGDVNPGGQIIAAGDVYIMGHLRGSIHAGASGNHQAVVAANYFEPLQVRIAHVVRRAPDVRTRPAEMEFAYLDGEQMAIEQMAYLAQYRAKMS